MSNSNNNFFTPKNYDNLTEYENYIKLNEIFENSNIGIQTERDYFAVNFSIDGMKNTINDFKISSIEFLTKKYQLIESRDWKIPNAINDANNNGLISKIYYRPFDVRYTYYTGKSGISTYPRSTTSAHLIKRKNLAISFVRQSKNHALNTLIIDNLVCRHFITGESNFAPLYLYPSDSSIGIVLDSHNSIPNFKKLFIAKIESKLNLLLDWEADIEVSYSKSQELGKFSPVDLLDYIYAVLHNPDYRSKYKEFLKIDFPRVPFDVTPEQFWSLVAIGSQLRILHLVEDINLTDLTTNYNIPGDNIVSNKIRFIDNQVFINDTQYFGKVSDTAWNFYIGGYQPAQKWLKDRKARELSNEDINHYQKIIYILNRTDELMQLISELKILP
jgi:predicted helicase